jgi:hypothetical protein
MKPEKQQLIHDLLESESHGPSTLLAAAAILRRRRQWRATRQIFSLFALAAATFWFIEQKDHRPMAAHSPSAEAKRTGPLQPHSLTDAELLSLFPDTPVGLATLPNGKKLLIFPRPADEAKYITRL